MEKVNMSEKDFSTQVEGMLDLFGWQWCHFRTARTKESWKTAITGHKGFVDYVAVRPPRVIFAELKSDTGKLSDDQYEWIEALKDCQRVIIADPLTVSGQVATIRLHRDVKTVLLPEIYVWKPGDSDEVERILRKEN